jgi:ATP-binding cassette subfamily B protein
MPASANVNATFLALFGVATVLGVATAARFYMVSWLGERVTADIRSAVYRHVVTRARNSSRPRAPAKCCRA